LGNFSYAVITIKSCDERPWDTIWTSGHISPGGYYEHLAYQDYREANDNEPFAVECTYFNSSGQPLPNGGLVTGIYWPDDFVWVSGNDYYCTNDF